MSASRDADGVVEHHAGLAAGQDRAVAVVAQDGDVALSAQDGDVALRGEHRSHRHPGSDGIRRSAAPIDPTDAKNEPMLPIERIEPSEQMDRNESFERHESMSGPQFGTCRLLGWWLSTLRCEHPVHRCHGARSFSDRGCDSLHRPGSYVACGEDAGELSGRAGLCCRFRESLIGQDESVVVTSNTGEPVRVWLGPDEAEQGDALHRFA